MTRGHCVTRGRNVTRGRTARYLLLACAVLLSLPLTTPRAAARPLVLGAPLTVVIDTLTPDNLAGGTDKNLTVSAMVSNTGPTEADNLVLIVGVGPAVVNRSQLEQDFTATPPLVLELKECPVSCGPTALPAGSSGRFTATIPLPIVGLQPQSPTVYPLEVRVDGTVAGATEPALGSADTYLPVFPSSVGAPLRVSWLWPLDAAPVLDAAGAVDSAGFPAAVDPGGRLLDILDLGRAPQRRGAGAKLEEGKPPPTQPGYAPITWAVEPALLAAVELTTHKGWLRRGDNGKSKGDQRPADMGAAAFLQELRTATRGADVIPLPYADPDAVAETRAGLTLDLSTAIASGRGAISAALLGATVLSQVGWVPGAGVDPATVNAYGAAGDTTLIVDGSQLPAAATALRPTQSAITTLNTQGPPIRALATDPDAQTLLAGEGRDQPSPRMAAQRLLALLAVIVGEAPNSVGPVRDLVLAPPRGFDPDPMWARDLLTDTGTVSWLRAVPLTATDKDPTGDRQPLNAYPPSAAAAELPASTFTGSAQSVTALRALLRDIGSMLPDEALTRPLDDALSRSESVFWRTDEATVGPQGSQTLRVDTANLAADLLARVRVATAAHITLTSPNAAIPVTVENSLPEQVTVRLTLLSTDRTKLTPSGGQLITVGPGRKQRILLSTSTQRAGTFPVDIALSTPSGRQFATVALVVHSTAYGAITIAITGGALAVLVVTLLLRFGRRFLHWSRGRVHTVPAP